MKVITELDKCLKIFKKNLLKYNEGSDRVKYLCNYKKDKNILKMGELIKEMDYRHLGNLPFLLYRTQLPKRQFNVRPK